MDALPLLQENVLKPFGGRGHQLECGQVDELIGVEDDLQVGVADKHSGSSKLDQDSPTIL